MVDSLSRFRRSAHTRISSDDEFFIPYYKPSPSQPHQISIGQSPPPARQNGSNPFRMFSAHTSTTPGAAELKSFKFPPMPPTPQQDDTRNFALRKAPSYGSLRMDGRQTRLPSSASVPTGLAAPKMLFSPLSRDVKGSYGSAMTGSGNASPRSRTFSAPSRRHRSNLSLGADEWGRQWATPTVCDRLVLARPSITPHVITPPASPETDASDVFSVQGRKVMAQAETRAKERDQWARYTQHRPRSKSFGNEAPRPDAPIIGNARVREEEFQRRNSTASRRRSNSLSLKWRSRRSGSKSSAGPSGTERPSFSHTNSHQSVGVGKSFDFAKRASSSRSPSRPSSPVWRENISDPMLQTPQPGYRRGHAHTQSSPELLSFVPRRPAPGPPPRTLRIQSPPSRKPGVVVIGAEAEQRSSPIVTSNPPVPLDFSKPLPDLPHDAADATVDAHLTETPDMSQSPFVTPSSMAPIVTPSPAKARSFLAQQHLRTRTMRAFQTPSAGPSSHRIRTSDPSHFDSSTRASSTVSMASPAPRRPTAMEEAISRSRAASTSTVGERESVFRSSAEVAREEKLLPAHTPELPEIVSHSPTFSGGIDLGSPIAKTQNGGTQNGGTQNGLMKPPQVTRTDTEMSKASGKTVYTDASEGWDRSGLSTPVPRDMSVEDTPSPTDEAVDRFKGLFFRTPQEVASPLTTHESARRAAPAVSFPAPELDRTAGLGFGIERASPVMRDRRSYASGGTSDGADTVEISTPNYTLDGIAAQAAHIRYSQDSGESSPRRSTFLDTSTSSSHRSGAVRSASSAMSHHTSEEFRLAAAPVRRPTIIATPTLYGNAGGGEHRTEIVDGSPEHSPNSHRDDNNTIDTSVLSPATFGAEKRYTEIPDPLETPGVADLPDTPTSPHSAYSQNPRSSFAPDTRYSAVPSFVDDFPQPPQQNGSEVV